MFVHSGASLHGHEYSQTQLPQARMRRRRRSDGNTTEASSKSISDITPKPRPTSSFIPGYAYLSTLLSPVGTSLLGPPASDFFGGTDLSFSSQTPQPHADPEALGRTGRIEGSQSCEKQVGDTEQLPSYTESNLPRPVTRFALCQALPPPRQILNRRPQILLQLRRINQRQPLPAIDVQQPCHCPCVPRDLGLLKRFPRLLSTAEKLCPNDIVVTRSPYDKDMTFCDLNSGSKDNSQSQDVLAVISPFGQPHYGLANIVLEDGVVWVASRKANGSFEFSSQTDSGHSSTVRWSRRSSRTGYHFNFCVVDPAVKFWPIQGALSPEALDVYGTYSRARAPTAPTFPVRSMSLVQALPKVAGKKSQAKLISAVSEEHKRLMTVTAIWVSLCEEGWPGNLPKRSPVRQGPPTGLGRGHLEVKTTKRRELVGQAPGKQPDTASTERGTLSRELFLSEPSLSLASKRRHSHMVAGKSRWAEIVTKLWRRRPQ